MAEVRLRICSAVKVCPEAGKGAHCNPHTSKLCCSGWCNKVQKYITCDWINNG